MARRGIDQFLGTLRDNGDAIEESGEVVFDLSDCAVMTPAGVVLMAAMAYYFEGRGIQTFGRKSSSWGARMLRGFLRADPKIGEPLTAEMLTEADANIQQLVAIQNSEDRWNAQTELVQITGRLEASQSARKSIDYITNEILENAVVHGYQSDGTVYPKPMFVASMRKGNAIEIAVCDRGIGIQTALLQRREHAGISAAHALRICTDDRVTGAPKGSPGFGLFCTRELVLGGGGALEIWSSGRHVSIRSSGAKVSKGNLRQGTLVAFRINHKAAVPYKQVLGKSAKNLDEMWEIVTSITDDEAA